MCYTSFFIFNLIEEANEFVNTEVQHEPEVSDEDFVDIDVPREHQEEEFTGEQEPQEEEEFIGEQELEHGKSALVHILKC